MALESGVDQLVEVVPFSFPKMKNGPNQPLTKPSSSSSSSELMDGWMVAKIYFAIMGFYCSFL